MLRFAFGSVAVSPLDKMGCVPVSPIVILFFACVLIFLRIGSIFRKPRHFWMYSVVTIFWLGSVELTLSSGGIRGVGRMAGVRIDWNGLFLESVKMWVRVDDVSLFVSASFSSMSSIYEYT